MTFYSRINRPKTIPAPKTEKTIPTFSLKINPETGKKELEESGKTNIYDKIQAAKEGTLIYNILDRYQKGETDVLKKLNGQYGDFTQMPKTLAEMQQKLIDSEKMFNELPLELRKEFNHSPSEFLVAAQNGNLKKALNKFLKIEEPEEENQKSVEEQIIEQQKILAELQKQQGGNK